MDQSSKKTLRQVVRYAITAVLGLVLLVVAVAIISEFTRQRREAQEAQERRERRYRDSLVIDALEQAILNTLEVRVTHLAEDRIQLVYSNTGNADLRAVRGAVAVRDVFGDMLCLLKVEETTPLQAGESMSQSYGWAEPEGMLKSDVLRGPSSRERFASVITDKRFTDLVFEWWPKQLLYQDGTSANWPMPREDAGLYLREPPTAWLCNLHLRVVPE